MRIAVIFSTFLPAPCTVRLPALGRKLRAACLAALLLPACGAAGAAGLTLYAAAGVKAPLEEMASQFEASTGQHVALVFDTAGAAEQRFIADSTAAMLITTEARLRAAQTRGQLRDGAMRALGDTVGGIAVRPGGTRPAIASADQLRSALLAAPRIAFSDPARGATVGRHFMQVIETLGIRDEVLKKSTLAVDGVETMHLVLDGKADLGITQVSEIMQADPSALLGPFPPQFDLATTYAVWTPANAPAAAGAFAALITSVEQQPRLRGHGLRPAP